MFLIGKISLIRKSKNLGNYLGFFWWMNIQITKS